MNCCNDYHKWQPGIGYYAEFGGNAEICIVPDPWVLQMVSEPWFPIPRVVFSPLLAKSMDENKRWIAKNFSSDNECARRV